MPPKRSLSILLIVVVLSFSGVCSAQLWSGILAPNRAIDWSKAGAGTIPARSTVCATLNAGASISQINSAINSCNNGVVQLGAGTFNLSGSIVITKSNVSLRGAGADQTFLVWNSTNSNCNGLSSTAICIWNGDTEYAGGPANQVNWTGGYAKGTTAITLSSVSNLKVGSLLVLDQTDPGSDTGNIWVCQTAGSNGSCSQQGADGIASPGRAQSQQVTVAACGTSTPGASCTSTNVTISPGLYAPNWSSSQSPQAWYSSSLPVSGVGIENLSLDYTQVSLAFGIMLHNATQSWIKGVRSINGVNTGSAAHEHILGWQSTHITVRDSYFYGSNPSSEGYGIAPSSSSADWLVENNICQHIATCTIAQGATGVVFGYNYSVDNYFGGDWQQQDGFHHSAGDSFLLWEGHEGIGFDADTIHGTSFMITHFRDYLNGHDPSTESGAKSTATFAYFPFAYSRYFNLVGSVLGTASYHTTYTSSAANSTDCGNSSTTNRSVIVLGYSDQNGTAYSPNCLGTSFSIPNDMLVATTLMRWGNYAACSGDSACNAARFETSEDASGAPVYSGLSSPNKTLPSSFYLSAKPSWWGTMPWPAVGPDVTGGNVGNIGGHVYHNPAASCYLNVMGGHTDGSSGALTFNATACYPGSGNAGSPAAPKSPTNLAATVH